MTTTLLILFILKYSSAMEQNPQDIIKKYEQVQRAIFPVSIESHTKIKYSQNNDGMMIYSYRDSSFIDDGERIETKVLSWYSRGSNETIEQLKTINNPDFIQAFVWDKEKFVEYGGQTNKEGKLSYQRAYITDTRKYGIQEADKTRMISFDDGPLLGYIESDTGHFADILKGSDNLSILDNNSEIDGKKCVILYAETENGIYKVWFAPEYDYNVLRMELTKNIGDKAFGYIIGEEASTLLPQDINGRSLDAIQKKEYKFILNDIKLQEINGRWLPVEGKYYTKQTYKNGNYNETWYETKREALDLNPDLKKLNAFVPKIDNGVPVLYTHKTNIVDYMWQDGKVVPKLDTAVMDNMDNMLDTVLSEKKKDNEIFLDENDIDTVMAAEVNSPGEIKENLFIDDNKHIIGMSKIILSLTGAILFLTLIYLFTKVRTERNQE